MATPFFLLFFLFTVVPVLGSVVISLTSFDMLQLPKFVGVDNYIRLFLNDDVFLRYRELQHRNHLPVFVLILCRYAYVAIDLACHDLSSFFNSI